MKKLIIILLLSLSSYLNAQVTPSMTIKTLSSIAAFGINIPTGWNIIDCSTGIEYFTLTSIPSTKSISSCVIGTDLKKVGTVSTISITVNNGITQSITNPTTTPTITLGLGAITPTSVGASGTVTGTQLISTIAGGTAPLSVTSTTKVTNLNADRIDDLHSYEQRLFNNAAQALGTNSFACGTGSYAGIRSGDAIYPYVQWQEFLCDTCIRVDANTTVTYTDSQGATQTYTNSTNYVQILCVITETVNKVLVDNVSVMPYNRCRTLYTYNMVLGSGEYVMSSTLLSSGQKQLIVYTWNTTSTIIPTSSASIYVATKSNNSNYSGASSVASGVSSVASGNYSVASGAYSVASGAYSVASGNFSVASGNFSVASGVSSVASGVYSVASGNYSVASGVSSVASGAYSVASGNFSVASGTYSVASGTYSVASGASSVASGVYSVASGASSVASGNFSVASGNFSVASGVYSVASGNYSVASGVSSVASGYSSVARDYYSQSHGYNTVASKQAEFVIGRYNIASSSVTNSNSYGNYGFVFGIGTSDANRINGFTLDWSGNSISAGTVTGTRLISNIAQGTAPLSVTSTTKVPRLNVANSDSLGGYPASHFGTGNGSVTSIATTSPLTGGTITTTGTIAINSDTLLSWARRKDTANIFLGKIRASHEYLGKYANAVSATNATNATLIYNQSDYDDLDFEWRIPFTTFDNNNPSYYYTDADITWNPFTKRITAGLNGTAAYANKVEIDTIATDLDARIPFMSATGGNQKLYMDNAIKYNSGTETLTVPNLVGSVTGNSSTASKVYMSNAMNNYNYNILLTNGTTSENQNVNFANGILNFNPSTGTLTSSKFAGKAASSNKTDSIFMNYDEDYTSLTYIPFTRDSYSSYNKVYANDFLMYKPSTGELFSNFVGDVTGNVSGSSGSCTGNSATSGTADVALALDDPTMYNLTDFNSYGAAAYSVPIANGSGGITWGATSGGINAKNYAAVVATSNVTQSGTGQTIDGLVCNEGATVLCTGQTIKASNGAWLIPESGAWTRRTDMDTWSELYQAYIPIVAGTTYGGSSWYCTIPSTGTLDTTDIIFTEFLFPSSIEAGVGLSKTGTTLSTNVDNSSIEIHADTLRIKDLGITTAKLANSSVTNTKVATGIDAAKIADGSVSNTEFQYINSVTSNVQTQINTKSPISNPTFTTNVTSPKFTSTITTGTSPFTVSSTTKVANLNADQVDGADLETTITNSDAKIPTSKAVETYISNLNNGGLSRSIKEINHSDSPYTVLPTDYTLIINHSAGNVVINLPKASSCTGRLLNIKDITNNATYQGIIHCYTNDYIDNDHYDINFTGSHSEWSIQSTGKESGDYSWIIISYIE